MKNLVHVENSAMNLKKEIVDECTNKEGCALYTFDECFMSHSEANNAAHLLLFSVSLLGSHWRMSGEPWLHENH